MKECIFKLIEIIDGLVGSITFHGETNHDDVSLDNLDKVDIILTDYTIRLYDLIRYHSNDYRYSGKMLAKKSYDIMKELQDIFNDSIRIYEERENQEWKRVKCGV